MLERSCVRHTGHLAKICEFSVNRGRDVRCERVWLPRHCLDLPPISEQVVSRTYAITSDTKMSWKFRAAPCLASHLLLPVSGFVRLHPFVDVFGSELHHSIDQPG